MMVYKIHILRVIVATVTFVILAAFLLFITTPQKCIQVSVSVQQWQPYVKRTRVVQALDEKAVISSPSNYLFSAARFNIYKDAWFRTRVVETSNEALVSDDEDNDEDNDDYNEPEGNDLYEDEDNVDYDGDALYNGIFEQGDFDYNETNAHVSAHKQPDFGTVQQMFEKYKNSVKFNYSSPKRAFMYISPGSINLRKRIRHKFRNITLINIEGVPIVEDAIYWSKELEERTPKGAEDSDVQNALQKLRKLKVQRVEPPTWNRCGRPKNQFVIFEDGSKACARYRFPHQYLVQGEILSFYLSRLLGIKNVPVVFLAAVKNNFGEIWDKEEVKKDLLASKWEVNTTVALMQWIENLERDRMPGILLSSLAERKIVSSSRAELLTLPVAKLVELLQWSDLIIFDYVTGNYDRVGFPRESELSLIYGHECTSYHILVVLMIGGRDEVHYIFHKYIKVASMQDAADKESKPSILHETIHNLVRSKSNGALWLIDNESGLLDSYSLLYGQDNRFLAFHKQMLNTTCLFRRSTVERIRWLHQTNKAGEILVDLVKQFEPLFTPIERSEEVSRRLQQRIAEVNDHINRCFSNFS